MVRWLGAHWSHELPPVYGADDDNARHVSGWIVDIVLRQFLAHHAEA